MAERPMLMSAPMVRAILAGTKTQTRRIVKPQPPAGTIQFCTYHHPDPRPHHWATDGATLLDFALPCPYGQPGDRLWVRETFQRFTDDGETIYKADPQSFDLMNDLKRDECLGARWRPAIHMPRWASRITLEITGVRVERLQDISADDARAEGCPDKPVHGAHQASVDVMAKLWFHELWCALNGPDSWAANPWVWVVCFRRLEGSHA